MLGILGQVVSTGVGEPAPLSAGSPSHTLPGYPIIDGPMSTILFDRPPCVFVRIRKSGSTSIVRGLFGGIDRAVDVRHGEFPEYWRDRFSFAVVRNPYDRLVSAFLMFKTYSVATDDEARLRASLDLHRVLDIVEDPDVGMQGDDYRSKLKLHSAPYTHPFYCLDRVVYVARYERFEEEYRMLAGRLGIRWDGAASPSQAYRARTLQKLHRRDPTPPYRAAVCRRSAPSATTSDPSLMRSEPRAHFRTAGGPP